MKGRRKLTVRLWGGLLAVLMLWSVLPVSTIALATGTDKAVTVTWTPDKQTADGTRTVQLTAGLAEDAQGAPAAAMVEIFLTAEEAAALQWEGTTIEESALDAPTGGEQDQGSVPESKPNPEDQTEPQQDPNSQPGDQTDPQPDTQAEPQPETDKDTSGTVEGQGMENGTLETTPANQQPPAVEETDLSAGGEEETPAQVSVQSRTGGEQAVLITKDDDSAVLRILLTSGAASYNKTLTFLTSNGDLKVDVNKEDDILVKTYSLTDSVPPSIGAGSNVPLLTQDTDFDDSFVFNGSPFTVFKTIPDEVDVTALGDPVSLDGEGSKDITYTVKLQKIAAGEGGKDYTFTVDLPESLSLPAGAMSYDSNSNSIKCGDTEIAKLEYQDTTASFSVSNLTLAESGNGFTFSVNAPADATATEADVYDITLTLDGGKLVRSAEAISGNVTLTVSAADTESKTASVTVTAGDATLPGEGGWTVSVTKEENKNQAVFWRDNEQTSARPNGWDNDRSFWKNEVKLYYTLTDQSGVTYTPTLLINDEDALAKVGLKTYPTFAAYGAHGFTVQNLPTELKQTDPNDPNSVLNTYTVSWSLEPPASVEGYDFRNITSDQVGEGKDYPSISTPGWYYMQEDTFTFTLKIRQGDEDPLGEEDKRPDKLRALLGNFQFNWTYTGGTGSDSILDMIEAGSAVPSYHDGVVKITGMWKYNVDGSPINYSVTEIKNDISYSADGKITTDELDTTGLLEEDEWYQIQYVNTGVPGEGQDTTALHSGGTLQLVRQGNIQYESTKIWLDSYGDGENSGRPNATFTLYRYRKGEDPGTAAPVKGYSVTLTQKTDENDNPTGGYAIKVMTGSGEDTTLADLPKYDTLDGAEFIYVVRETLSGTNAGQYEQVFGTVWVDDYGTIDTKEDLLPEGALPDGNTARPAGNTYLYNGGTLTNHQKDTIPVTATKTWKAAAYQSQFDNVAVELTLQYREKTADDSGEWQTYQDGDGKEVVRYLYRFYAESLSDTLVERPSMPRYQTTTLDVSNKELEYRWLETAVYTDAENATETDLGGTTPAENREDRILINYGSGDNSAAGNNPVGSFTMNGSSYTVSYGGSANNTQITNSVAEYLDYEIIKEWHIDPTGQITIQILRSVAGGDFKEYLEFTMKAEENKETVTVSQTLPENSATPEDASPKFKIEGKTVVKDTDANTPLEETWNALVSGLPRFDEQGRPYEYLLLEANAFPTYETEIDNSGNYKTKVINSSGGDGFNLLARKVWLDDGDMEHRDPVILTLYNKNTNEPVMKKNGDGSASTTPYTIILGDEGEKNLWHKVVWIGTSGLGNTEANGGDGFDADDVYLVETSVGLAEDGHTLHEVNHKGKISYADLYPTTPVSGGDIFEVTTENHRYQVSYQQDDDNSGGVDASFTITNRRLGSIDLTATKYWVDGREGNSTQVQDQIRKVLEGYAKGDDPTYLALAFRLVFDESMGENNGWEITYSGPSAHSDTVCVGGEDAEIYSTYQAPDEDGKFTGYQDFGSSDQIILGYVKNDEGKWTLTTSDSASFLGLPKYDTAGEIVAYSIEEVWLDVTQAGVDDAGKITPPEVVDFKASDTQKKYPKLYALWQDFSADYKWGEYQPDVDGSHTRDEQELEVTNIRRGSKDVTWTVEWQDHFTSNSNLRPDIYLDVYQVTYQYEGDKAIPVISRVTGQTLDWDMNNSGSWTATMRGVPAFDEKGNEIFYYAVQRTVMAAGDYDYQAALYEMNGAELGTRDEPAEGIAALNGGSTDSPTTSITDANGNPYDLAVLGKRDGDTEDTVDSIQWGSGQPTGIGSFGGNSNYPKYALLEGGTIINTLAENYTIEGVKYWTNLPTGWEDTRLPQVTFTVSRYTEEDKDNAEEVAKVVISSDLWQELKSGTQYKYLIQYEGINVLDKNEKGEVYVKGVYAMDDTDLDELLVDPTPLARYEEGTGALWTYTVEETVDWGTNEPDSEHQIFDDAPGGPGFTFTNNYNPTEGSIQVKKFLYLPMTRDADGNDVPESYPAVTFKLTRQVDYLDGKGYVADESFETQTVTLTSAQVKQIWENSSGITVTGENLVSYGKDAGTNPQYIWATLRFTGLDMYAPNGTKYQYSVAEDRTYLQGYDTWGEAGDVTVDSLSSAFGDDNKLENVTGTSVTVPINNLMPENGNTSVDATFKNQRTDPQEKLERFTATKIWEDNNSTFRPNEETFKGLLTLTRTAKKQGGTGGAAAIEETLKQDEDYIITIKRVAENSGTWTITITPTNGKSFEKYAPNGMPWTYTLKERTENGRLQLYQADEGDTLTEAQQQANKIYTPSTPTPNSKTNGEWQYTITSGRAPVSSDLETYSFGSLTNSIMTLAKFEKKWVDADGKPITQDYLGFDLTVDFQLQVREMGSNENWVKASEWTYDGGKALGLAEGADVHSLTGRVVGANHNWTYTFEDLPGVVQDSEGNYIFLEYRVIETKVSWGDGEGQSQTISWDSQADNYSDLADSLITDTTFSRSNNTSTTTNKLATTSVSVTKVWDDNDNQYGTRPGGSGPWTWGSWFVLQRTTEENPTEDDWENVALFEQLYGNNAERGSDTAASGDWEATITGLPTMDYRGTTAQSYTYRVRELQPLTAGGSYSLATEDGSAAVTAAIVPEGETYNPNGIHYTTTYGGPDSSNLYTVTNSMDTPTEMAENVEAIKEWAGENNTGVTSITFQLKYSYTDANGKTVWGPADFLSGGQWEKTANAGNDWRVSWEDLPETDGDGNKVTAYRVVEKPGTGWVQMAEPVITHDDTNGTTTYSYTFTNSITTSYSVEKVWLPVDATTASVTLGLYRTTDSDQVSSTSGTKVPVNEMASDQNYCTATLNSGNSWKHTFTGLPKYNANGQEYYYYALELDSSGDPIDQNGKITLNAADYEVSYGWATDNSKTTVTNTTATSLTGTKTWKDDSNKDNDRPTSLTLILERQCDGGTNWTDVSTLYTPAWDTTTSANQNQWTYTYTDLPTHDVSGKEYSYRVREKVPDGYKLEHQKANGEAGEVEAETGTGKFNFTNVRTGTVSLVVNKTWVGDNEDNRPTDITLKVERKLINQEETEWQIVSGLQTTWTKNGDTWSLTYSNLPQFDENGVRYEYRITEDNVPVDYEAIDSTNTDPTKTYEIRNIRKGALEIHKEVSGNRGETNREFHFTVTLTGRSSAGTQATDVDDTFTAVYTKQDGSTENGTVTFTDGVSTTEIALKDEESVVISGLPAGLTYEVTETERDTDGYSTTGTGWTGTIPTGDTVQAEFENYRNSSSPGNRTDVTGTKTWVDDNDAAGLRPDVLELTLYRSVAGGPEQVVSATPSWTKTGNVWTYRYANLPKYDSSGKAYTYRVVETVPEGYVSTVSGNNFTNTLTKEEEKITLTGTKRWLGDTADGRPASITVVLYDGGGQEVRRVTVTAAEDWRYTFADLPKYDAQGGEIQYYVREEGVPPGYQVSYDGLNIVNRKEDAVGGLRVTKQVTGSGGEHDRAFSFTVTLGDATIQGTYGEMTFVDGVATFTLRHGQSFTAVGLPAGLSYTVTESVPEDYTAADASQAGEIPASGLETVTVVNNRDLPDEPDGPDNPDTPDTPDTPDNPDNPSKPDGPDNPQGPEVQTGDRANPALYGGLSALFAAGLAATLYWGRKGRKDDL